VPANGGNWVVSETTSPVDYSPQITAAIAAEAIVKDAPSSFFHSLSRTAHGAPGQHDRGMAPVERWRVEGRVPDQ